MPTPSQSNETMLTKGKRNVEGAWPSKVGGTNPLSAQSDDLHFHVHALTGIGITRRCNPPHTDRISLEKITHHPEVQTSFR